MTNEIMSVKLIKRINEHGDDGRLSSIYLPIVLLQTAISLVYQTVKA